MDDHELLLRIYEDLQGVKSKVNSIDECLSNVEEDTKITRGAVNTILEWADDASIQVIPLFKKKPE